MVENIIICSSCNGSGKVQKSERVDYHHRIDDEWDEPCSVCDGTGRMVVQTQTILRKLRKDELELRKKMNMSL